MKGTVPTVPFRRGACSTESSLIRAERAAMNGTTAEIPACRHARSAAERRSSATDDCLQGAEIWGCHPDKRRRKGKWAVLM